MMNDPFADLYPSGGGSATQQQPAQRTPIPAPPRRVDPYAAAAEQRAQANDARESERLNIARQSAQIAQMQAQIDLNAEQRRQEEDRRAREAATRRDTNARTTLRRVIDRLRRVRADAADNNGWFETGTSGSIMRAIGPSGTAATDIASEISTIDANAAFQELARMRAESPTGGALGAITERELDLLRSTVANLDPNQSQETFLRQVDDALAHYEGMAGRLGAQPGAPAGTNRAAIPGAAIPSRDARDSDPGRVMTGYDQLTERMLDQTPRGFEWNEQQQAEFSQLVAQNQGRLTVGQVIDFYERNGVQASTEQARAFVEAVNAGEGFSTTLPNEPQAALEARLRPLIEEAGGFDDGSVLRSAIRGAADVAFLGTADEIAALGDTVFGTGIGTDSYRDNLAAQRMVDRYDSENNFIPRTIGQVGGGLLLPYGRLGSSARAGAAEGAMYAGAYGFGSGEGGLDDRAVNALMMAPIGAAGGAAVNALAPRVGNYFANRSANRAERQIESVDREVIEAGARQNIPIRQPDARPSTRAQFAAAEATPGGNAPIGRALQADEAAVQSRVAEVGGTGQQLDEYGLGTTAQTAVNRNVSNLRTRAGRLYEAVERSAPGARAQPTQTLAAINQTVNDLLANGANATSAEVSVLRGIAADLEQTGLTVSSLQTQRRNARQLLRNAGADPDAADARLMQIMSTAGQELDAALAGNARAQGMLRQANRLWQEQAQFRQEIGRTFTGTGNNPLQPEDAARRLNAMFRSGGRSETALRLWRTMEPDERADTAATIAQGLGVGRNGEFSLAGLSNSIRNLNPRVAREVFGEDGWRALQDLRVIARAKADTRSGLNNSRTGVVENHTGTLRTIVGGAFGGSFAGVPGAIVGGLAMGRAEAWNAARQARLLLNPDFTRWLRSAPDTTNPTAINRYFARLEPIAARSPVIAADVRALQDYLRQAYTQSPTRAAAEGQQENNRGQIPPQ